MSNLLCTLLQHFVELLIHLHLLRDLRWTPHRASRIFRMINSHVSWFRASSSANRSQKLSHLLPNFWNPPIGSRLFWKWPKNSSIKEQVAARWCGHWVSTLVFTFFKALYHHNCMGISDSCNMPPMQNISNITSILIFPCTFSLVFSKFVCTFLSSALGLHLLYWCHISLYRKPNFTAWMSAETWRQS